MPNCLKRGWNLMVSKNQKEWLIARQEEYVELGNNMVYLYISYI